jgi:predicted tellurium resistance membrane protein TerC
MAWDLMGAAMLITVGVLFLASVWAHVRFHYTWPVILIVIGVVLFLRSSAPTTGHIPPGPLAAGTPAPPSIPETPKDPSHD